jgi:hypothetical protein
MSPRAFSEGRISQRTHCREIDDKILERAGPDQGIKLFAQFPRMGRTRNVVAREVDDYH